MHVQRNRTILHWNSRTFENIRQLELIVLISEQLARFPLQSIDFTFIDHRTIPRTSEQIGSSPAPSFRFRSHFPVAFHLFSVVDSNGSDESSRRRRFFIVGFFQRLPGRVSIGHPIGKILRRGPRSSSEAATGVDYLVIERTD